MYLYSYVVLIYILNIYILGGGVVGLGGGVGGEATFLC